MNPTSSAKSSDHYSDLLLAMGIDSEDLLIEVMPTTIEDAQLLGAFIQEQSWFDPQHIGLGGVFQITAPLLDMREEDDPNWELACAMIDAMPTEWEHEEDEDHGRSSAEIYDNIYLNMHGIRHRTEERCPRGLATESGYRIFASREGSSTADKASA